MYKTISDEQEKNTKKGFKDSKDLTILHMPRNFSTNHKKLISDVAQSSCFV